jgi:hypothetical protein
MYPALRDQYSKQSPLPIPLSHFSKPHRRNLKQLRRNSSYTMSRAKGRWTRWYCIHPALTLSPANPLQHAVALPQSTSQLIPPLRPNLTKETSQISLSMSSLIDFENDTAPEDDNMDYIEEASSLPKQRPQTEAETRKEMLLEVSPCRSIPPVNSG